MESHEDFMQQAYLLAEHAEKAGEVPVGAILVYQNEIIGRGWNQPIGEADPTAHAEIQAIRQGAEALNNYRLPETTLYVTLEPCPMCAGAMIHARIKHVVFGAYDPKTGAAGSVLNLLNNNTLNHQVTYEGGILETRCSKLLKNFFKKRRELNF